MGVRDGGVPVGVNRNAAKDIMDRYDDRLQVSTNLIESYDRLMEFVAKHTSDKFCLINNISTSIRDVIAREVISNILIHRDFSSAYPAKLIIEKNWLRTENWCRPRRQGNIHRYIRVVVTRNYMRQMFLE